MEKTSEINSPEARSASEVVASLQRARKNLRIYPSNNPIYAKTVEETLKKFIEFFDHGDTLELKIQRNEFLLGDEVIYSGTDKEENLALFFFRDGLRSLTIANDLSKEELLKFLSVVAADLDREDVEEDLVTLLWEKDFMSIKYKVDESLLVEDENFQQESEEKVKETPTEEGVMQEAYSAPPEEEEVALVTQMPITEDELELLAKDIESYGTESLEKLTDILFDMLYASENIDEFKDVVRIMGNAVDYAAMNNDLRGSLIIFGRVKEMIQKTKNDNIKKALFDVLEYAGSERLVEIIGTNLESKEGINDEDFKEYVSVLRKSAIPAMVELLGKLQSMQGRKKVIMALTYLAKKDIGELAKALSDPRWTVVRNILMVLRETGDKRALEYIAKALNHEEAKVRREAVKAVSELGGVKYINRMVDLLYDQDQTVSVAAAYSLGKLRNEAGLAALIDRISDKNLMEQDPQLLKKYFEALSYFKYDDVIGFLEDIIRKNPFFGRSTYNEVKAYAVYCLGLLKDPRAIGLLEDLRGSKVKQISDYSTTAIKRIKSVRKG